MDPHSLNRCLESTTVLPKLSVFIWNGNNAFLRGLWGKQIRRLANGKLRSSKYDLSYFMQKSSWERHILKCLWCYKVVLLWVLMIYSFIHLTNIYWVPAMFYVLGLPQSTNKCSCPYSGHILVTEDRLQTYGRHKLPVQVINDRFIREIPNLTSPNLESLWHRKSMVSMPTQAFPGWDDFVVPTLGDPIVLSTQAQQLCGFLGLAFFLSRWQISLEL